MDKDIGFLGTIGQFHCAAKLLHIYLHTYQCSKYVSVCMKVSAFSQREKIKKTYRYRYRKTNTHILQAYLVF